MHAELLAFEKRKTLFKNNSSGNSAENLFEESLIVLILFLFHQYVSKRFAGRHPQRHCRRVSAILIGFACFVYDNSWGGNRKRECLSPEERDRKQ